jgi:methyl-accepting chemotaxis protein
MFLANWPIGRKLAAVVVSILFLFVASSGLAIYQFVQQSAAQAHIMEEVLVVERALKDWSSHIRAGAQRSAALTRSDDPNLAKHFEQFAKAEAAVNGKILKYITDGEKTPEQAALYAKIQNEIRPQYMANRQAIYDLRAQGDSTGADRLYEEKFLPSINAYMGAADELLYMQRATLDSLNQANEKARVDSIWKITAFTLVALVVGIVLAMVVSRSITRPLRTVMNAAGAIAALDLSGSAQARYHHDETGQLMRSMDEMRAMLHTTMAQVLQASQSISTACEEVASGSNDLSSRTESTAANLEESASAVEELSTTAQQCTEATRQAELLTRSSSEATQQGFAQSQHVQRTMLEIQQSSQKIGDIIGVIDGIAFQTNILALNAAVEAARAGEQGRGFAVVAGEVRTLAGRSAEAAKEIRQLIDSNLQSVSAGTELVQQSSQAMQSILDNVTRVQDIVAEVNASTNEQSLGATQLNQSIATIDQMTQQNAALVEESSAAAAHLNAQAQHLRQVVSRFKLSHTSANSTWATADAHQLPSRAHPRVGSPRDPALLS